MSRIKNLFKKMDNQGQTLIEVIISLFIITIGIIGCLALANYSIHAGTQSREKVQASLLAQEGIEVVKNIRDTNWIQIANGVSGVTWDTNLPGTASLPAPVPYTAYSGNFPTIGSLNGPAGGTLNNFQRITTIDWVDPANPDPNKKKVTCTVTWPGNTVPVTAIDYITNWQTNNP
jgi:type II secretory pathway pseudopilin PulG